MIPVTTENAGRTKTGRLMRGAILLLACIFVGAALTVCTVWFISPRMQVSRYQHGRAGNVEDLPSHLRAWWPTPRRTVISAPGEGGHEIWTIFAPIKGNPGDAEGKRVATIHRYRYGWPLRSMERLEFVPVNGVDVRFVDERFTMHQDEGAISIPPSIASWATAGVTKLPITIIWPGFIASTLAWACGVAVLGSTPGFVRRAWRRRHSMCTACGYAMHELAICPECGRTR